MTLAMQPTRTIGYVKPLVCPRRAETTLTPSDLSRGESLTDMSSPLDAITYVLSLLLRESQLPSSLPRRFLSSPTCASGG
jgi:hypothetical protein